MEIFRQRLKDKRLSMGLTQEVLGNKVGVSKQSVCKYEKGIIEPTFDTLIKLAVALDCSTDYLLGLEVVSKSHVKIALCEEEAEFLRHIRLNNKLHRIVLENNERVIKIIDNELQKKK